MTQHPIKEIHLTTVSSTNDIIRREFEDPYNTASRIVVTASHQTQGRGRGGKMWYGEPGQNIYISFGEKHDRIRTPAELASAMWWSSLAVVDVVHDLAPYLSVRLKYPNDIQILHDGQWAKMCGILVEHVFQGDRCLYSVVGIGINVHQRSFPDMIDQPCTSLAACGVDTRVEDVINHLQRRVWELHDLPTAQLFERGKTALNIEGRHVRLLGEDGEWMIGSILDDGRIVAIEPTTHQERVLSNGDSVRYLD